VTVPAGAAVRVNSVLAQMGVSDQSVGRITVSPDPGMVVYAQTAEVDADTGDVEIARLQ